MPVKKVDIEDETWIALDLLARDSDKTFQELADEAFRDLLKKHDRPIGLRAALRGSAKDAKSAAATPKKVTRRAARKA